MQRERVEAVAAIPGNPCGATQAEFGGALAVRFTADFLHGKNHVFGLEVESMERIGEILAFYRDLGLRCAITAFDEEISKRARDALAELGVHQVGVQAPLVAHAGAGGVVAPYGARIRRIDSQDPGLDRFLALLLDGFSYPPLQRQFEHAEIAQDSYRLFVAEIDGDLAAIASMSVRGGMASLIAATTVPRYRGRGLQRALIAHRLEVAVHEGCDLVTASATLFSTSFRNLERCGFRQFAFGSVWRDRSR
jgi:GNAT superfamily N-acetyltransferase